MAGKAVEVRNSALMQQFFPLKLLIDGIAARVHYFHRFLSLIYWIV
ncbi:hypothetical protein NDS46_13370 [Paenibacillus thiaminolyticus]|nr:hypothetical protein [Paenibacillus thiaminolyticus]WCF10769.1 hypothetical protein NDS46_13370 [Paenibacillus thiaminolyticus]